MNVVPLRTRPLLLKEQGWLVGAQAMPSENDRNNDQYRQRHEDQYNRRDQNGQPKNVADIFWRMGYDINNAEDLKRLAADFRWVSDEREKASERWPHRFTLYVSIVTALIGSAATAVMQWLVNRH